MPTAQEIAGVLLREMGKEHAIRYATKITQTATDASMSREYREVADILLNK